VQKSRPIEVESTRGLKRTARFIFSSLSWESTQKAIDQIHEKKYYEKYQHRDKTIVLVGVSFSKQERNINDWIIQTL
jgi:hypothetical protein